MGLRILPWALVLSLLGPVHAQQGTTVDFDKLLEKGDGLLEEAKKSYEEAREKSSVAAFVDAGFKLEECRIKFVVIQEIGPPEKQKLAADRLRSVNQLAKLVHDGRVAISGRPADPVPSKTPDAAPEPAKPVLLPESSPVDVTKRSPMPDAAKQREAEKLVKDLFKDQYAKKTAADRKVLARLLIQEAAKSQGDPAALWVLCREAGDAATQAADIKAIVDSVELAARFLDVDVMALKNAGLTAAAKTVKSPEECAALTEAMFLLMDDLVAADLYDSAEKLATVAVPIARRSNNGPMSARAGTRLREISEAKLLFQGMKGVLETLAKNPDQDGANSEMGQYLCYVKGNWELGLRFMVKSADPAIKSLAQKELAQPTQSGERVDLADVWFALGDKEKSPLRKSQMLAHAKSIYESALPDSSSLLRSKIEKRLGSMESTLGDRAAIDLLKLVDLSMDILKGGWSPGPDGKLTSLKGQALMQVPYVLPEEYDLRMSLVPTKGAEIALNLVFEKVQFDVTIDGWNGLITGVGSIDGKMANVNETAHRGQVLKSDAPNTIIVSIRKTSITLSVNGDKVLSWKPDASRLSTNSFWTRPVNGTMAFGGWVPYSVTKIELTPVTGRGKPLR